MLTEQRRSEIIRNLQLQNTISIYANLSEDERADEGVALRAVSLDGLALLYTPIRGRSAHIVERAVNNCRHAAVYVEQQLVWHPRLRLVVEEAAA